MKLIGKLKEMVEKAETREEKKELIEAAGVALTDEELDKVAGGNESPSRPPVTDDDNPWDRRKPFPSYKE